MRNCRVTLHVSVWVEIWTLLQISAVAQSRSTWACELKCSTYFPTNKVPCHAPRERVSWNTWSDKRHKASSSHAPRERVSWNDNVTKVKIYNNVTLHVSVWVEIQKHNVNVLTPRVTLHVSVWVEIQSFLSTPTPRVSHAPRERVSWNAYSRYYYDDNGESRSTWACESTFVSTQDLSILNNTNNRVTKVGRYFYTQILYIFHVLFVKSTNSHPEICANKWFII